MSNNPQLHYGYRAPINSTKKIPQPIKQVTSVNILGSVTSKPQFDFRKNPVHRALYQRYNQSCRAAASSGGGVNHSEIIPKYSSALMTSSSVSPVRVVDKSCQIKVNKLSKDAYWKNKNDPLYLNHPKISKFTDGFTAMYSDNGLTAASRIKKSQEQKGKEQLFLELQGNNNNQRCGSNVVSEIFSARSQSQESRFDRLHKERKELIFKMNNAAIKIQCLFRQFYARKKRLEAALKLQSFYRGRIARKNFQYSQKINFLFTRLSNLFIYHQGSAFYDLLDVYVEDISKSNKRDNVFLTEDLPSPSYYSTKNYQNKQQEKQFTPNFSTQQQVEEDKQQNQLSEFQVIKGVRMQSMITEEQEGEGDEENRSKNMEVILMHQQSPEISSIATPQGSRILKRHNDRFFKPLNEYYQVKQANEDRSVSEISATTPLNKMSSEIEILAPPLQLQEHKQQRNAMSQQSIFDSFPSPSKMPSMMQDLSPIKPLSGYDDRVDSVAASMARIFRRDSAASSIQNQKGMVIVGGSGINKTQSSGAFNAVRSYQGQVTTTHQYMQQQEQQQGKNKHLESSRTPVIQRDEELKSIQLRKQHSSPEKLTSYSKVEMKEVVVVPSGEEGNIIVDQCQQESVRREQLFNEDIKEKYYEQDKIEEVQKIQPQLIEPIYQQRMRSQVKKQLDPQKRQLPHQVNECDEGSKFKYFNRLVSSSKTDNTKKITPVQKIANNKLISKITRQPNNNVVNNTFKPTQPIASQRLNRLSRPLTAKSSSSSSYNLSKQMKKLNKRGSSFARLKRIQSARRDIFKNPTRQNKGRQCEHCSQTQERTRIYTTNASCTTLSQHYRKSAARLQIATNQPINFLSTETSAANLQNVKSTKSMGTTTSATTVTARLYSAKKSHSQRRLCSASSSQSTSYLINNRSNNSLSAWQKQQQHSRAALLLSGRTSAGEQIAQDLIGSGRIDGDPQLELKIKSLNQKALGGEAIRKYHTSFGEVIASSPINSLESSQKMTRYQKHQFFSQNCQASKQKHIENPFSLQMSECGGVASLQRSGLGYQVMSHAETPTSAGILSEKGKYTSNQDAEKQFYSQPHQKVSSKFEDVFPELTNIMQMYGPPLSGKNKMQTKQNQVKKDKKGWIVM